MAASLGMFLFHARQAFSVPLGLLGDHQRYQRAADYSREAAELPGWRGGEYRWEINKHPLYILVLGWVNRWGFDIPRLSLLLVLLSAAALFFLVGRIGGTSSGLLAGGLFLASPFVLSQVLVFSSHGHLGLLLALLALSISLLPGSRRVIPSCLIGLLSALAVLSSYHSLQIIIPLITLESVFRWKRDRAGLAALFAVLLLPAIPLLLFHPAISISGYRDFILEAMQDNVVSAGIVGWNYTFPFFAAFESENGLYSLTIAAFLAISILAAVSGDGGGRVFKARKLLIVVTAAFILFEMLAVKLNRVYYPVWTLVIGFSATGVMDFFRGRGKKDLSWAVPVVSCILMLFYWLPASRSIVSTCRAGIEIFPSEESRQGVFVLGDQNVVPLNLPSEQVAASPGEVEFVVLRKFPLPSPRSSWQNPGSRHLFVRRRLYEELKQAEGVRRLRCWRSRREFFYFSELDYTFYRQGLWQPGPSLVVPVEIYRSTRAAVNRELHQELGL